MRAQVFFSDDDRRFTLEMRLQCATRFGAEIWAYCLMGNPVHLIAVPQHKDAPGRPFPGQWTGNWQGFLNQELTTQEIAWIRQNLATGRPTASREFVNQLEQDTGKLMTPEPRGRKPAALANLIDLTEDMFG